jgi:hypothetical protein
MIDTAYSFPSSAEYFPFISAGGGRCLKSWEHRSAAASARLVRPGINLKHAQHRLLGHRSALKERENHFIPCQPLNKILESQKRRFQGKVTTQLELVIPCQPTGPLVRRRVPLAEEACRFVPSRSAWSSNEACPSWWSLFRSALALPAQIIITDP